MKKFNVCIPQIISSEDIDEDNRSRDRQADENNEAEVEMGLQRQDELHNRLENSEEMFDSQRLIPAEQREERNIGNDRHSIRNILSR